MCALFEEAKHYASKRFDAEFRSLPELCRVPIETIVGSTYNDALGTHVPLFMGNQYRVLVGSGTGIIGDGKDTKLNSYMYISQMEGCVPSDLTWYNNSDVVQRNSIRIQWVEPFARVIGSNHHSNGQLVKALATYYALAKEVKGVKGVINTYPVSKHKFLESFETACGLVHRAKTVPEVESTLDTPQKQSLAVKPGPKPATPSSVSPLLVETTQAKRALDTNANTMRSVTATAKKVRRASRAPPLETESEDEIIILLRDKLKRGKIAEAALKEMEGKYAMLIRKYELLINVQQLDKKAGEALKEQVMTCTNERDTLQAENHKLRSENEQLCNDKGGAISKIEELTRKNEELNRGNEELEQKNTALTTDSHTEIEDLKGQVGRLEAERNDLFTECQESTATNKQLIDAKTGLTAQVKVLAAVNDTLAVEKENYIAEKESFDNEMKKRLSGKITLVKDKANFKKEKSDLINDKAKLIKEKNDLINEKADLTSEKNDWIAEKIALIAENDKLAEEKEKLTDQVKEEQQAAKDTLSNFEAYKMRVRDLGNS